MSTVLALCDVSLRESGMWEEGVEPRRFEGFSYFEVFKSVRTKNTVDVWFGARAENDGVF